jgi:hypothetical protein
MNKREKIFVFSLGLIPICVSTPLVIGSCAHAYIPLRIVDFQLETPTVDYENNILHSCRLNEFLPWGYSVQ